jgi:hypothetical protein
MDAAGKDGVIKARCLDVTVFHPASDRFARRTAKFDRGWGYRNPSLLRPQATGSFVRSAAKLHRGSAGPPARKAGQLRGLSVIRPIGQIRISVTFWRVMTRSLRSTGCKKVAALIARIEGAVAAARSSLGDHRCGQPRAISRSPVPTATRSPGAASLLRHFGDIDSGAPG